MRIRRFQREACSAGKHGSITAAEHFERAGKAVQWMLAQGVAEKRPGQRGHGLTAQNGIHLQFRTYRLHPENLDHIGTRQVVRPTGPTHTSAPVGVLLISLLLRLANETVDSLWGISDDMTSLL